MTVCIDSLYNKVFHVKPEIVVPVVELNNQSTQYDDQHPHTRCSPFITPGKFLMSNEGVLTLLDCIYRGLRVSKNQDCLGMKNIDTNCYEWFTYHQVVSRMRHFGSGLVYLGCEPSNNTVICIYGINSIEWVVAEYACYHYSMAIAPIYDNYGSRMCQYILHQVRTRCVIVDTNDKIDRLFRLIEAGSDNTTCIRFIVLMNDNIQVQHRVAAKQKGIKLYSFAEVEKYGQMSLSPIKPPKPNDIAVVSFTSGVTAQPKGAMLSHANIVAGASSVLLHIGAFFNLKNETSISYLPVAHCFERMIQVCLLYSGGRIGMYSGEVRHLPRDMRILQPTIMPCVPRIMNRIYNRVITNVKSNKINSALLDLALQSKKDDMERFIKKQGLWDQMIFKSLQQSLGGQLKLMLCGYAALSPTVMNFMRCAFGCMVLEGYGLTECGAPATFSHCGDSSTGHAGVPLPCNMIKLIDIPEMDIFVNDSSIGEILIKGTNVFVGYYQNEKLTKEVVDEDGWLHTGDVGQWLKNGTLNVLGRKKHIFRTSRGEIIAPEKLESMYSQSSYIGQVFVYGDCHRDSLVGIIVPDADRINLWCYDNSMILSVDDACRNTIFKKSVLNNILEIGKREGLKQYEQVRDIYLHPEPFSLANGLLTATMKTKRPACKLYFKDQVDEMYNNIDGIRSKVKRKVK